MPSKLPHEGTKLREIYDYFYANKGLPIDFKYGARKYSHLRQLTDFYGLDIRFIGDGKYCLCGEYFKGGVYVDYIAERLGIK